MFNTLPRSPRRVREAFIGDIPKALGKMLVKKGPVRSPSHLARVRAEPCLACVKLGRTQMHDTEAHHCKYLSSQTMGKRKSDLDAVPICTWHHTMGPDALHRGAEPAFWAWLGVDPLSWIDGFLKKEMAA